MSATIPILDDDRLETYTMGAGQTKHTVPFPFQHDEDVAILVKRVGDAAFVPAVLGADYTLTGAGAAGGGEATFTVPFALYDKVLVKGDAPVSRTSDFEPTGRRSHAALNNELDRIIIHLLELRRRVDRALQKPDLAADYDAELQRIANLSPGLVTGDAATIDQVMALIGVEPQTIDYPTRAVAANSIISPLVTDVRTRGNLLVGDCGQELVWRKVEAAPATHDGWFVSLNGLYFELRAFRPLTRMFSTVGNGIADDAAAINKLFVYSVVMGVTAQGHRADTHHVGSTLTIPHGLRFNGNGCLIQNTTGHIRLMYGNKVGELELEDFELRGARASHTAIAPSTTPNAHLIHITGEYDFSDLAKPPLYWCRNITLRKIKFWNADYACIWMNLVDGFTFEKLRGEVMGYAGILGSSCGNGNVVDCRWRSIGPGNSNGTSYGITWTRESDNGPATTAGPIVNYNNAQGLITSPRSWNVINVRCDASNCPYWIGFDSHAGDGIWYIDCTGDGMAVGVGFGNIGDHAPKRCGAIGCRFKGINFNYGVAINGAAANANTIIDYAEDMVIINNRFENFGSLITIDKDASFFFATSNLRVWGNTFRKSGLNHIRLHYLNADFVVAGNRLWDHATPTTIGGSATNGACIRISSLNNTGYLGDNRVYRRDTAWASAVVAGVYEYSDTGVRVQNDASNKIEFGYSYMEANVERYVVGASVVVRSWPRKLTIAVSGTTTAATTNTFTVNYPKDGGNAPAFSAAGGNYPNPVPGAPDFTTASYANYRNVVAKYDMSGTPADSCIYLLHSVDNVAIVAGMPFKSTLYVEGLG